MAILDRLDRQLIFEIDRNSRQSISSIARTLREGRDKVEYRLQRLIEEEIIKGFTVWVDLQRLGYHSFKIYLRLENDRDRVTDLLAFLRSHPQIFWTALCDGAWDVMLAVAARSSHEFHAFHVDLLSRFNSAILNFSAITLINLNFYTRGYLVRKPPDVIYTWGTPGNVSIDDIDKKIIKILVKDSRLSNAEIGERTGVAQHVVAYRIKKLEDTKIICGYRANLDLRNINMLSMKCQLTLRSFDATLREALVQFCRKNPNIIAYIEQIADSTIEIELEVEDYDQYHEIIGDIRSEYSRLIRNFQTLNIRQVDHFRVPDSILAS